MSLLSTILGGGLGFATGGPIGGLAGLLAGGTSERQSSPKPPQTAATSSPLQQYLAQEAFLRGYQEIMGATPPQNFGVPTPQLGQGQSVGGERDQQANQRGGMGYSPTWGPQQVPGGGGGDGAGGGGAGGGGATLGSSGDLYSAWMQRALAGQEGLPESAYQAAYLRGLSGLNRQAQVGSENLRESWGQRGLLQSGLVGQGEASIERSRLGALADYTGALEERNLAAARSSQQQAAGLYAAERQGSIGDAARMALLNRQISSQEAPWWEPWANLANAYVGYRYRPQYQQPGLGSYTPTPIV